MCRLLFEVASHDHFWQHWLIRWAGTQGPCKLRCVTLISAMLIQALTYLYTQEWGCSHFWVSHCVMRLLKAFASCPSIPPTSQMDGVKCLCYSRHAARCLRFFSYSCCVRAGQAGLRERQKESKERLMKKLGEVKGSVG